MQVNQEDKEESDDEDEEEDKEKSLMAKKRDEWDAIMRNQMELKEPPPRDLNFLNKDNKPSSEEQQAHNTNNNKDTTTTTKTPSSPLAGSPLHKRPRRDRKSTRLNSSHT